MMNSMRIIRMVHSGMRMVLRQVVGCFGMVMLMLVWWMVVAWGFWGCGGGECGGC
jgi:hypothetical protein